MCVCHIHNQSLTNVIVSIQVYMQVYLHIYIHIYVQVAHNFDTFYDAKLKFCMIYTQTKILDFLVGLPLGRARGQYVYRINPPIRRFVYKTGAVFGPFPDRILLLLNYKTG